LLPASNRTQSSAPPPGAEPLSSWDAPTRSGALSSAPYIDSPPARADSPSTTPGPVSPTAPGQSPAAVRANQTAAAPFLGAAYPGHYGRDDGGEHRAPRYLISAWNTTELLGESPLVAPPVIGE